MLYIFKVSIYDVFDYTSLLLLLKLTIVVSLEGTVKNQTLSNMPGSVKNKAVGEETMNSLLLFKHSILCPLILNIKIRY